MDGWCLCFECEKTIELLLVFILKDKLLYSASGRSALFLSQPLPARLTRTITHHQEWTGNKSMKTDLACNKKKALK